MRRLLLFLPAVILFASCGAPDATPDKLRGRINVGFVVVDGVYNSELMAPWDIFHHTVFHTDSGMNVFSIAPMDDEITTFEGIRFRPDFSFETAPRVDVLVVPSAEHSMSTDLENHKLIEFVKKRGRQAVYIMSLCDGAFVLAKAGLLDSLTCTTFPSDVPDFRKMFPGPQVVEGVSFVHHNRAITSVGGAQSYEPAMYLVHLIYGEKVAGGVGKGMVIDWSPADQNRLVVGATIEPK